MDPQRIPEYQNGAEGFIKFVEENVRFAVPRKDSPVPKWLYPKDLPTEPDPKTGKSFAQMWKNQKQEFREALKMKNGRFIYRLIVFCWPRGEGKSLMVCLIQIWKFFCFPRQQIVFGALSKDQTRFVHYDMIQSVILNSPKLVNVIGKTNVQRAVTVLKNSKGEVQSSFQPISSYSGIVSNITGYTFSEMFDMKDPKFFVQLDGSIRNIVNALGTIDSTVSAKEHILYRLYEGFKNNKDKLTYFSYRSAPNASPDEFWHPHMDEEQLNSYRRKFPPQDFDRYFRNVWELDSGKLFSAPAVKSIFYFGYLDRKNVVRIDDGTVKDYCNKIQECEIKIDNKDKRKNKRTKRFRKKGRENAINDLRLRITSYNSRLYSMDNYYKLYNVNMPKPASHENMIKLSELYDTNWSILAGLDRADPMAKNPSARSILTVVAKGLTGSKSSRILKKDDVPSYMYVLLHLAWIEDSTLEGIKHELSKCYYEYDGIDSFCAERWGTWDLAPWCEEHEIKFEPIFPSYEMQRKAFNELYTIVHDARFKTPNIIIPGSKSENLLAEELESFDYHPQSRWYGSPQKEETQGIQDDSVYALGWTIYGGRNLSIDDFRQFKQKGGIGDFGMFVPDERNVAYSL